MRSYLGVTNPTRLDEDICYLSSALSAVTCDISALTTVYTKSSFVAECLAQDAPAVCPIGRTGTVAGDPAVSRHLAVIPVGMTVASLPEVLDADTDGVQR